MLLRFALSIFFLFYFSLSAYAHAKIVIKVGGYPFSPYVTKAPDGTYSGLTLDVLKQLNKIQDKYDFTFVSTSSLYRYQAFSRNRFELILFENKMWGWQHVNFYTIPLPLDDGEVYITQNRPDRNQDFFEDLKSKKLVLVDGYHYNITRDITDKALLKKEFDVSFVNNNHASIEAVLRERGEVAPVTWSYLQFYLKQHPESKKLLLSSKRWDQRYQHQALLSHRALISQDELLGYFQLLESSGTLDKLAKDYNLSRKIHYRSIPLR
ncbi:MULTISPECIES: transporter substrate-binding domain-containing protein [unclassified Motilimonas]|uniref:transporter substrate-binding domain-containing protein n=1 Tax=Motilimonas TaxID=1914248 RepID=UPI001E4E7948|nr:MULTISPECIES: transporter substrate-binding domain-containing protein [unclassified Motilimonas]MCE0558034.1 transporter substrate-binding domain-containing protein [Motilimonas sp. E26]MDO6526039.1 transporter substrate-binding domain-containing protein [Motilimonas sp. 1_MG-2023]